MKNNGTALPVKKWEPVALSLLRKSASPRDFLADDISRKRLLFFFAYPLFILVSGAMYAVGPADSRGLLSHAALAFAAANLFNFLLCMICKFTEDFSRILFAAETLALLTFLLVVGEPGGLGAVWVLLLPAFCLFLYGIQIGSFLSLLQYAVLLLLFLLPRGRSFLLYDYPESFLKLLPLLYAVFLLAGLFFKGITGAAQKALAESRGKYEYLYRHDALTGIENRCGFNLDMDSLLAGPHPNGFGLAILSLDHFKSINDSYGRENGNRALRQVAEDLSTQIGRDGIVCRWSGEEFAVLFFSSEGPADICDRFLKYRRYSPIAFSSGQSTLTVSIGLLEVSRGIRMTPANLVNLATANLRQAEKAGRNCLVSTRL